MQWIEPGYALVSDTTVSSRKNGTDSMHGLKIDMFVT